jgi:nicotinate-nucleotide pyrophosphorylase (carboxylating)
MQECESPARLQKPFSSQTMEGTGSSKKHMRNQAQTITGFETDLSQEILASIQRALAEDIGPGDATTDAIVPAEKAMAARIIAKQDGIVAGLDVARATFQLLDAGVDFTASAGEGQKVGNRQALARISGPARALLTGERTALNFLGRMSGIATLTRQFVDAVTGTNAVILDTR